MKLIDNVLDTNDLETAQKLLKMIRKYRKNGLKQTGEYGIENLVYKTLRNSKSLEKLQNFIDNNLDKKLSVKF